MRISSGGSAPAGTYRRHRRLADRERPGLIEHQRGAPGQAFQYAAAFHHHPAPRRRGQPGHQGHRRGQDKRARRGHHQDGDRPRGAAQGPSGPGHGQGQRQEPHRVPVGEPDERRLGAFRLGDQADDPGVGAASRVGGGTQVERGARVKRPAADAVPGPVLGRPGLAGERGLVQDRHPRGHRAIHREHVAGCHQQQVAGSDLLQWHRLEGSAAVPPGGPGCPGQQGVQVMPGPLGRPCLQRAPAGEHDADHCGREQFADRHRTGQRQQRDNVYADASAAEAVDRGPQRVTEPAGRGRQPGHVRDRVRPGQARQPAHSQTRCGGGQQHQRRSPAQPRPDVMDRSLHHPPSLQPSRREETGPEGPAVRDLRTSAGTSACRIRRDQSGAGRRRPARVSRRPVCCQRSVHDLASLQYQRTSAHASPPSGTSRPIGSAMPHREHCATSNGRRRLASCAAAGESAGATRGVTGSCSGSLASDLVTTDEAGGAMVPPRGTLVTGRPAFVCRTQDNRLATLMRQARSYQARSW